ncbi:hypothetical protein AAX09_07655 [Moraxella bovoculi]|uniref:hypothetical protein n=1 Tax=Moraxella bovoculi TaxID=386891 RepID=UPI0006243BB9|nr:hypothetical protein [Moraxella bovoculi]AKG19269.1 hypothetical protein AAX09_07655 [Moraxella bovoculi]
MAVNIRFDYYTLDINKRRKREPKGLEQLYFGKITLGDFGQWLYSYSQNVELGDHGQFIISYRSHKKWVRWVKAEYQGDYLKLLFTYNDKEVDARMLANQQDGVLVQAIPGEEYGQRTLLHIVIDTKNDKISVQKIEGFTKDYLIRLIKALMDLTAADDTWEVKDPVTNDDIACMPHIQLNHAMSDKVVEIIKDGGLRGIVFSEREDANSKFDFDHHITTANTDIVIRAEGKSFLGHTKDALFGWMSAVEKEKSTLDNPRVSLLIKDPQTGSEVKHEVLNGVIDGFAQKTFLGWDERKPETTQGLSSEKPIPIKQFYDKMIENF